MTAPRGLARKSLGTPGLWFFGVSASAPMTVVAGGSIATFAATGVVGVPLSFLVLMGALLLFTVGFTLMSRDVPHTASFYAFVAVGLGRVAGVGAAALAVVAYNALQFGLYGLLGATAAGMFGGPWWLWSLLACAALGILGVLHIDLNTRVLAVVLIVELAVIVLFDVTAFTNPANNHIDFTALRPDQLFTDGVGGVFALSVGAFIGFESIIAYREEARNFRSVRRAAFVAIIFLGTFYTLSSWALSVAVGADSIVAAAQDPNSGLPFATLAENYGPLVAGVGFGLLVLSIFGAMLSFHYVAVRYVYGLAREGVLPSALKRISGSSGNVPVAASLVQTATAFGAILLFVALQADPITVMFTWLTALAAISVLLLMIAALVAVLRFYNAAAAARGRDVHPWQRVVAPAAGVVALLTILVIALSNLGSLVGPDSRGAEWIMAGIIVATVGGGVARALYVRTARPGVFAAIGRGQPRPYAVPDAALARFEL